MSDHVGAPSFHSAKTDAREMVALLSSGTATIEKIRADIIVSERDKVALLRVLGDPALVEKLVAYRGEVLAQFDAFVAAGAVFVPRPSIRESTRRKQRTQLDSELSKRKGDSYASIAKALAVSRQLVALRMRALQGLGREQHPGL